MGFPPRSRRAMDEPDERGFAAAARSRRDSNTPSSVDVQAPSSAAVRGLHIACFRLSAQHSRGRAASIPCTSSHLDVWISTAASIGTLSSREC
eukprot:1523853-Pleurochrysis_carterae.AAC.1